MKSRFLLKSLIAAAALATIVAAPVISQADDVVEKARDAGLVGEQADGYLGFPKANPSADLKARVDQINIKRKAIYTDLSGKRGVTVNEVGAATACQLLASRVEPGEFYRDEAGNWRQRAAGQAVAMPSFCPPA